MSSGNELDSQLRAVGVNKEQRKRLIAAARLGGIPNPLKQLGLKEPVDSPRRSRTRSRSPRRNATWPTAVEAAPASGAGPLALTGGAPARPARAPPRPAAPARSKDEEDPDLDSFLAGGRAIMAKAKAMGAARREQAAREQEASREAFDKQQQRETEEALAAERIRLEELRRKEEEEREREEEESRREARRRSRREEKLRRKEQKKRLRAEEEEEIEEEEDSIDEFHQDEEAERRRQAQRPGFFSQAFKGNQQQRALWSEPIKGHVSNHYKGTSDADLERRFRLIGAGGQDAGEKLMTEEQVLAMLRNRKSKGGR
mmetsp:Transcript_26896/g.52687  ORF Transcript_26896/g.52687 Transcript_26896/m.52687 type:complete len:315 (-) Transcript_26896:48-992(-)